MSYMMGNDSWKSRELCYNHLADPNSVHDDGFTYHFYPNPAECNEFLMQQSAFRQHMSYAPEKESNDAEKCIY